MRLPPFDCLTSLLVILTSWTFVSASETGGRLETGSQSTFIHEIGIYDSEGAIIDPASDSPSPFSTEQTCGKCHDYKAISSGWHFNSRMEEVDHGRPGEPWVITDEKSATQIPVSYRNWPGLWQPKDIGLSDWEFLQTFGRHMPGGTFKDSGTHDPEEFKELWEGAGTYQIDCMSCHSLDRTQNQTLRHDQIEKHNLQYISITTMGIGSVEGAIKDADSGGGLDESDPFAAFDPAFEETAAGPAALSITYDMSKFDENDRTFFDVSRKGKIDNCFFCHSNRTMSNGSATPEWHNDQDVHISAGLSCTDCHRNGIDHDIARGYLYNSEEVSISELSLSCQGCHYGVEEEAVPTSNGMAGRLGSPLPAHAGIPPIHFDEMSCTSCHSGPYPKNDLSVVQTSLGHALGLAKFANERSQLPFVQYPVYARGHDGKIAPHKILWPAFWARINDNGESLPILPSELAPHLPEEELDFQDFIKAGLKNLSEKDKETGFAYIAGGMKYTLEGESLISSEDPTAEPYLWAFAHDVRPASQSIGAKSCQECHSPDSPFLFASFSSLSPRSDALTITRKMTDLMKIDESEQLRFAGTFAYRPVFKVFLIAMITLLFILFIMIAGLLGHRLFEGGRRSV